MYYHVTDACTVKNTFLLKLDFFVETYVYLYRRQWTRWHLFVCYYILECLFSVFFHTVDLSVILIFYKVGDLWEMNLFCCVNFLCVSRSALCLLAANFEDHWWPLQTVLIQMRPHKTWCLICDRNCLTLRLYIVKKIGCKQWIIAIF